MDDQYRDLLMVKKINKAFKEIKVNEDLKDKAREYMTSDEEGEEVYEEYDEEYDEDSEHDDEQKEGSRQVRVLSHFGEKNSYIRN